MPLTESLVGLEQIVVLLALAAVGLGFVGWARFASTGGGEPYGQPAKERSWTFGRVLPFLVAAAVIIYLYNVLDKDGIDGPIGEPGTGQGAPQVSGDWSLVSVRTGEPVSLAGLRGKVLFVNVWATWCPPCVSEMPSIQTLYDQFADDPKVEFLLVANDDPEAVTQFLARTGYTMPVYQPLEAPPAELESSGIPATYMIDDQGRLRSRHIGAADWSKPSVVQYLQNLRAEAVAREGTARRGSAEASDEPEGSS